MPHGEERGEYQMRNARRAEQNKITKIEKETPEITEK